MVRRDFTFSAMICRVCSDLHMLPIICPPSQQRNGPFRLSLGIFGWLFGIMISEVQGFRGEHTWRYGFGATSTCDWTGHHQGSKKRFHFPSDEPRPPGRVHILEHLNPSARSMEPIHVDTDKIQILFRHIYDKFTK